jgi:hypothetical protein
MIPPPKPLLDRLPAIPPRPASKPNVPQQGKEDAAKKRLTAKLDAMGADELAAPPVDPRTAAVAALMVANFVGEDDVRKRFTPLVGAKLFDAAALEDLPVSARFVLRILPKLGPDLDQRPVSLPEGLLGQARTMKEALVRVAERHLADHDDAHGRLVTVRLGESPADLVYDLRMLADLCRDYSEILAAEAVSSYRPDREREARRLAQQLEDALLGPLSAEELEWRAYLLRALAMLVPIYEEVCRAGRFLFHHEKPEARFPTLASVARVRRRLRRETTRRIESSSHMPAVRLSQPPKSVPPELSLVDVSAEGEKGLAGALVSKPTPAPMAAVVASPIMTIERPGRAPAAAKRSLPTTPIESASLASFVPTLSPPAFGENPPSNAAPAADAPTVVPGAPSNAAPPATAAFAPLDLLEAVTLDFAPPTAGEDADFDLDTADLDIEVTYASESNFYADLAGNELGLFVATFVVKPPGTPLAVRLSVPELDEPVRVSGTVGWVREFSPSIEAPPGMGIALDEVKPRARKAIEAFMKVRPPLLHDD